MPSEAKPELGKLIKLAADVFNVPVERLAPATRRGDLSEWDSLAHVRLIMKVEAEFGVTVPIEAFPEIVSIVDFAKYLSPG